MKLDTKDLLAAIGLKQLTIEAQGETIRALQQQLADARATAPEALDMPPDGETIVT